MALIGERMGPAERSLHEVLIVDDSPASRYATARLLRSVGFRTREAATGAEALLLADESISAMVLDVHLPDIDGYEVCRTVRLRAGLMRLPILHLSAAYITDDDKVRGLDSGADAYLTHPVEPAVLASTVQALVRARMAEEAMRRSEIKFRAIYVKAPSGICLLDAAGRLIDANPALLQLLRRDLDAVIGKCFSDFAPPDWVERIGALSASRVWRGEFPLLDAAGTWVYIECSVSPLAEEGMSPPVRPKGEYRSAEHETTPVSMAVVTDVSERVSIDQARRELLEREQAARHEAERVSIQKDDLIAVLSHELRTPLHAIMGWTHVLLRQGGTEDALRGLKAIERNGKAQARLLSDIMDVSSINLGKLQLSLEPSDPGELVRGALEALRGPAAESGVELALEVDGAFRQIQADPGRFHQIIWNLVSNSIKFCQRGAHITVSLVETESELRLSVVDDGQGIDPKFLPHLFSRFSQGDSARTRSHGGLGLGLSIVKHLVELHRGIVIASSPGMGLGSRFDIHLPATREPLAASHKGGPDSMHGELGDDRPDIRLEGIRILVVDDDRDALAVLQIILADRGARVEIARNYEEALRRLASFRPDVLLSDVGMPGKDGHALLREVRRMEPGQQHVPAIALSAFARDQDVVQALAAGFDAHSAKPLQPLELIRLISELARLHGPRAPESAPERAEGAAPQVSI